MDKKQYMNAVTTYVNLSHFLLIRDAIMLEFNLQCLVVSQLNMANCCDKRLPRLIELSHQRLKRRMQAAGLFQSTEGKEVNIH